MMKSSYKKRSRDSEIALLQQISTSLDAYHGAPVPQTLARLQREWPKSAKKRSPDRGGGGASKKSPINNFLVVKAVVKGMVRACVQEKLEIDNEKKSIGVIDALIEEYRFKYATLTKKMVTDALVRHQKSQPEGESPAAAAVSSSSSSEQGGGAGNGNDNADDNDGIKLGRCIRIVDEAIDEYYEKIESLKRKRELAASRPDEEKEKDAPGSYFQRRKVGKAPKKEPTISPRPRGRPPKNTPETALIREITERYAREREALDRLPNGAFETIVEEAKKDLNMEHFDLSLEKIRKRVTWNFMHRRDDGNGLIARKKKREVNEEVYRRYERIKVANGGRLSPGTLTDLIEAVKLEHGVSDVKMITLENKVRTRFKREHPEFVSTPRGVLDIGKLTAEEKKKRQTLLNEVTRRYVRRKEDGPKKLPDGELDRIIEAAKDDLGIHEFDVPKNTIRGRLERKSLAVMTLGKNSPYDAIDAPLVATINTWLSQGVSVTRAQGLEFANTLLKGTKMDDAARVDEDGNEIFLDAKWWRNFLDRNKKKLVCSND